MRSQIQSIEYRFVYPDFLPNPIPFLRDRILEKLERRDMFRRRQQIDMPEFYVGKYSIIVRLNSFSIFCRKCPCSNIR